MAFYLVKFAVESAALGAVFDKVSELRGVVSTSFLVERQDEAEKPRPEPAPKQVKHVQPPMKRISAVDVIRNHVRQHGPSRHRDFHKALMAAGYNDKGIGSAIARAKRDGFIQQSDGPGTPYSLAEK